MHIYLVLILIVIIISYLLGSINFSIIITKKSKLKSDIRTIGSGNAGFTNVLRSVGKKQAIFTMVGDFLKCIVAILLSKMIFSLSFLFKTQSFEMLQYIAYLSGIFCFLGHIYPCFFQFKGGKGVLTACAMIVMTDFRVFIISISAFLICLCISKIISLSSIIAATSYFLSTFVLTYMIDYKIYNKTSLKYVILISLVSLLISFMIIYLHKPNIKRILNGEEKKISSKKI